MSLEHVGQLFCRTNFSRSPLPFPPVWGEDSVEVTDYTAGCADSFLFKCLLFFIQFLKVRFHLLLLQNIISMPHVIQYTEAIFTHSLYSPHSLTESKLALLTQQASKSERDEVLRQGI